MGSTKDYPTLSTLSSWADTTSLPNWFTHVMQRETRTRLEYTLKLLEYRYAISTIRPGCTERIRLQSYSVLIDIVKNLSLQHLGINSQLLTSLVKPLEAVVSSQTSVVVVLLTSSSKSLLFLALAYLKDLGVLVIVLLFRELLNNIKERLIAASILHLEYNSAQSLLTLIPVSLSYSYATALLRA
ncbi:hypothetical protein HBI20_069210 [Parastagonospora nodorum]|nr:hypothetical protein HBI20_069210 [Parastagonospora nodorum]